MFYSKKERSTFRYCLLIVSVALGCLGITQAKIFRNMDVMILYSEKARDSANFRGINIEQLIIDAVEDANQSFSNSNTDQRVRLVHMEITSNFTDKPTPFENRFALQSPDDGDLDYAHALRNQFFADAVVLVADFPYNDGVYGIGNAMVCGTPSFPCDASFENNAFAALKWDFLEQRTFAHELGHLMGLHHARGEDSGALPTGAGPDGYGHKNWPNPLPFSHQFSTVMAKANKICGTEGQCIIIRRPYFSNPNIVFQPTGEPMGIDHNVDPAHSANAARVIREVTGFVTNKWRENVSGLNFRYNGLKKMTIDPGISDRHLKGAASIGSGFSGLRFSYSGIGKASLDQQGNLLAAEFSESQIDCPPNALRFTSTQTGEVFGGIGTDGVVRAKGIVSPFSLP